MREGAAHRGDVAVEALGELDDADPRVGRGARDADALDELAGLRGPACRRQEEVFERHRAALAALAQHQLGAERDQRRRHVADRRAVGDIAADRAGVADLEAADAADQLAQIGVEAGERVLRLGIAHARADA